MEDEMESGALGTMLINSNTLIDAAIEALAEYAVEAAYAVPTATTLSKYYFDATSQLRSYLARTGTHDFSAQPQGDESKVVSRATLVFPEKLEDVEVAYYRPASKTGDPRIRVTKLGKYASAGDLLAFIVGRDSRLYIINVSKPEIFGSRLRRGSPLSDLLGTLVESPVATELEELLRDVSRRGPVRSLRSGPTGVGYTLETLLGIKANSNKAPDYKGIELKSGRAPRRGASANRSTLFSKIPDWSASELLAKQVLHEYGYMNPKTQRQELYCTISAKPNPQSLYFDALQHDQFLEGLSRRSARSPEKVLRWEMDALESALKDKHRETFWVRADVIWANGIEYFSYASVTHTRAPLVGNFRTLIALGKITMDLTMSAKPSGGVRDHGYLFKIHPRDLPALFPEPRHFDLRSEPPAG